MAIAAGDFTISKTIHMGKGYRKVIGRYTPSGTYTSGGEVMSAAIANAVLGLSTIDYLNFTPLVTAAGTTYATPVYDHGVVGVAKIHVMGGGVGAHTHDILVIGGQTAQTHAHDFLVKGGTAPAGTDALNIKATIIGKEAATDATNLAADVATKGGVQLGSTATSLSMISTDTLGKEQATNRTIAGSASATKGGVVATSAGTVTAEMTAATNLSTYSCSFVAYGQRV